MWKNININIQNIETETEKAVLIKMPNKSNYEGYKFWHPAKLIRSGRNSYAKQLGYTEEFTFKLKKYGNGKYNKFDVIDEIEIDSEEFEETFGVMDKSIISKDDKSYIKIDEPKKVNKEVIIEEDLKNE